MRDRLSHDMRHEVEYWCRRIVSGCGDDNVFDELYGHVEDSMLAYMNGETMLSEEDAFMLVREHFGNPDRVRTQLCDAHANDRTAFSWGHFLGKSAAFICVASVIAVPFMTVIVAILVYLINYSDIPFDRSAFELSALAVVTLQYAVLTGTLSILPIIHVLFKQSRDRFGCQVALGRLINTALAGTVVYLAATAVFALIVYPGLLQFTWDRNSIIISHWTLFGVPDLVVLFLRLSSATGLFAFLPWILNRLKRAGFIDTALPVLTRSRLIVLAAVLGAVFTPPDPISMIALAVAMILTFEAVRVLTWSFARI